jgi:nickel-dependent lactate racemase
MFVIGEERAFFIVASGLHWQHFDENQMNRLGKILVESRPT